MAAPCRFSSCAFPNGRLRGDKYFPMQQAVEDEVQKRLRDNVVDAGAQQQVGLPTSKLNAVVVVRACMAFLLLLGTGIWLSRQKYSADLAEL